MFSNPGGGASSYVDTSTPSKEDGVWPSNPGGGPSSSSSKISKPGGGPSSIMATFTAKLPPELREYVPATVRGGGGGYTGAVGLGWYPFPPIGPLCAPKLLPAVDVVLTAGLIESAGEKWWWATAGGGGRTAGPVSLL